MSGLQINVEKTKAVWIGAMSKSERKLCNEFKLDWNQNPLKILGVEFTTEVYNIWEHNTEDILHKVDSIIMLWEKRKLTLPGRIAVIKSLALSKFVHLLLALHNPPDELVKGLEFRFYKFLWNNGPDRISRKNIIKDTLVCGLRMINIKYFVKSLNVSWFRRYIFKKKDENEVNLSEIDLGKLFSMGDNYAVFILRDVKKIHFGETRYKSR